MADGDQLSQRCAPVHRSSGTGPFYQGRFTSLVPGKDKRGNGRASSPRCVRARPQKPPLAAEKDPHVV